MRESYSVGMVGQEVGNYRITEKIGQGGMGAVYAAQHTLLGRPAAIKVLLPELCRNQEMVNRFFNEAKATTAIRHPGIVEIYDFGHRHDGSAYIVMEYLEGESLSHRMKRIRPLPVPAALLICSQVSGVLAAAHAIGILHRDLKPDNVFLVRDPEMPGGERAKLLDFGIAKLTDEGETGSIKTRTGVVMGSPAYMSPEQCKGAGHVRYESDLYSLGCILYQMLCGEPPFTAEGSGEVIAQHIYREPVPLRQRVSHVSPAIDELVLRLLAKDPAHRPRSAAELKVELDRLRDSMTGPGRAVEPVPATTVVLPAPSIFDGGSETKTSWSDRPFVVPPAPQRPVRRRMWIAAPLAAGLALAGVVLVLAKWHGEGDDGAGATLPDVTATPDATPVSPVPASASTRVPVVPPSTVEPTPVPPPAAPTMIKITITSRPKRARIYRSPSNAHVGVTPYELEIAPTDSSLAFVLKKTGYRDLEIEVRGNEAKMYTFELKPRSRSGETSEPERGSGKSGTSPKLNPFDRSPSAPRKDKK
jgi:eukaryotic-like serine/threonine-protein kinase